MLWFYENDSTLNSTFFGIYKDDRCHMILEGLNNVCSKSEAASSKSNEILKINACKNLYRMLFERQK